MRDSRQIAWAGVAGAFTRPWRVRRTCTLPSPSERIREYVCTAHPRNSLDGSGYSKFGQ